MTVLTNLAVTKLINKKQNIFCRQPFPFLKQCVTFKRMGIYYL